MAQRGRPPKPENARIVKSVDRYRRELDAGNGQLENELSGSWLEVVEDLAPRIRALTDRIAEERAAGRDPKPAWLYQEARYRELLDASEREFRTWSDRAARNLGYRQGQIVRDTIEHVMRWLPEAMGANATSEGLPDILIAPGTEEVRQLLGTLQPGSPLRDIFDELPHQTRRDLKKALTVGVATGQNPVEVARSIRGAMGITRHRALTIARTETMRTFRETTRRTLEANSDVVQGWIWHSAANVRTCAACWAMHGTFHPVTERLAAHVRCRCAMLPQTKTWAELGYPEVDAQAERVTVPTGAELFRQLSPADRARVLGPTKAKLYESGAIELGDLIRRNRSKDWGESITEASVADALKAAKDRGKPKPKPRPKPEPKPKGTTTEDRGVPVGETPATRHLTGPEVRQAIRDYAGARMPKIAARLAEIEEEYKEATRQAMGWFAPFALERKIRAGTATQAEVEEVKRANAEYEAIRDRQNRLGAEANELRREKNGFARELRERFLYQDEPADVRGFGTPRAPTAKSSQEAKQRHATWQEGIDAFTRLVGRGHLDGREIQYEKISGRAHYRSTTYGHQKNNEGRDAIAMAGKDRPWVIVHELGHWLEERAPGLHELIRDHYGKRTAGEKPQPMSKITGNKAYKSHELSRVDKWVDPYSGKDYAGQFGMRNSEIVSMTLQQMYEDVLGLIDKDPETFDLLWHYLRGANPTPRARR